MVNGLHTYVEYVCCVDVPKFSKFTHATKMCDVEEEQNMRIDPIG